MSGSEIRKVMQAQTGKFGVLVLWFIAVFVVPMIFLIPSVGNIITPADLVDEENDAVFKQFISLMQGGKWKEAHSMTTEESRKVIPVESFESITPFLKDTTDQMQLVSARFNTTRVGKLISWGGPSTSTEPAMTPSSTTVYEVAYEVQNNNPEYKYALITMGGIKKDGKLEIQGFHVDVRDYSVKDQANVQWNLFLMALGIILPLFIGYSAFNYLSTATNPGWMLLLVILLVNLYIFVAGDLISLKFGFYGFATQSAYGVWIFVAPIPLGAIYYWITRKKYLPQ